MQLAIAFLVLSQTAPVLDSHLIVPVTVSVPSEKISAFLPSIPAFEACPLWCLGARVTFSGFDSGFGAIAPDQSAEWLAPSVNIDVYEWNFLWRASWSTRRAIGLRARWGATGNLDFDVSPRTQCLDLRLGISKCADLATPPSLDTGVVLTKLRAAFRRIDSGAGQGVNWIVGTIPTEIAATAPRFTAQGLGFTFSIRGTIEAHDDGYSSRANPGGGLALKPIDSVSGESELRVAVNLSHRTASQLLESRLLNSATELFGKLAPKVSVSSLVVRPRKNDKIRLEVGLVFPGKKNHLGLIAVEGRLDHNLMDAAAYTLRVVELGQIEMLNFDLGEGIIAAAVAPLLKSWLDENATWSLLPAFESASAKLEHAISCGIPGSRSMGFTVAPHAERIFSDWSGFHVVLATKLNFSPAQVSLPLPADSSCPD